MSTYGGNRGREVKLYENSVITIENEGKTESKEVQLKEKLKMQSERSLYTTRNQRVSTNSLSDERRNGTQNSPLITEVKDSKKTPRRSS